MAGIVLAFRACSNAIKLFPRSNETNALFKRTDACSACNSDPDTGGPGSHAT